MNTTSVIQDTTRGVPSMAKIFISLLGRLQHGHLELIMPDNTHLTFGDAASPLRAVLQLRDWRACARILRAGDIGFAESYEAHWLDSPDLTALLTLAIQNNAALDSLVSGGRLSTLWYRLRHFLRPNTRKGSRRNIHAHYDIGNAFYGRWLDASWTYSSAVFYGNYDLPLEQAQANKYQRIIDELGLKAGDKVLEVGCGWGGFAVHAAKLGIAVHGITISPAQLQLAQERVAQENLGSLVQLALCDYRDVQGEYDAVVSIEMVEAVGERFWPEYFKTLAARLKQGGQAMVQSITIQESVFERYRSTPDFIQQYIFPGGMLPSPERFNQHAQAAGLKNINQYHFGRDYAETLRRWRFAWEKEKAAFSQLGLDERFMRIWRLYFSYCEVGFDEGRTDVIQFLLQKE
ncbi:SAM-dependent methyltransferase [Hydromonas duriensis]|uniref:Cyclopropane-fatty-acyl-phospholipid synthase n=1 Tax=Hydromonas duriensis TaxID=1527608 RepID=A0A4R6Y083_9BURK|nr:cyclopropane-fatty-acyl-phospholipid synthase family protein [Hydromonas duriensis]TDR27837.1 cyclopropane-fatty-acyl-phospholipid synthase [Hydromonas duriensis]